MPSSREQAIKNLEKGRSREAAAKGGKTRGHKKRLSPNWLVLGLEDTVLEMGGAGAYCRWLLENHPQDFNKLIAKRLPNIVSGEFSGELTIKWED